MLRILTALTLLTAGLSAGQLALAKTELDNESSVANYQAKGKDLPGTLVVRTAKDGSVAIATIKEKLTGQPTEAQIAKLNFVPAGKATQVAANGRGELDKDQGSESWFVAWGGWGWGGAWGWGGYGRAWAYGYGYAYPYAPVAYAAPAYYGYYNYGYYNPCW